LCPSRVASRGAGDGARLANCGRGEKEKVGLNGRVRPPVLDGRDVVGGGRFALVSLGLGCEAVSDILASDAREALTLGGYVPDVGVGRGADWM
jgi:hypothetical protein